MQKTTITVTEETHARLKRNGKFGESFDNLVNRLLDCIEGVNKND
jgi:predicted CopG family antitoxin